MKKKVITIALAIALVATLGATAVFAGNDQIPSAKAAYFNANVYDITSTKEAGDVDVDWVDILTAKIKTGEPKDLIIDVSAESALVTDVTLKGDTWSEAKAKIKIRVLLDGVDPNAEGVRQADPLEVIFANRIIKVEGDLTHKNAAGDPLDIQDHEFTIFLESCNANAFNFCIQDIGSGVHTIHVQAKLDIDTGQRADRDPVYKYAHAYIGEASVVVDEVMLKRMD